MAAVDHAAREAGKSVLVLDTVTGGDAERLYERSGWQRVGYVPKYALMPDGPLSKNAKVCPGSMWGGRSLSLLSQ